MTRGERDPMAAKAWRLALGIGAAYAVAGIVWILLSDTLLASLSADPGWLTTAQHYKGVFYVLATAAGLSGLVRAGYQRLLHEANLARNRELQALQWQEARFRQLHQSLGEVLWLATADGRQLIYLSPAFEALYGRPAADFQQDLDLWLGAVHPDDRARAMASNAQLQATGQSSCDYRICRPDGSVRWVSDRKRLIVDADGQASMIGGIAEDITTRIERDAARATNQAELARMVAERTAALQHMNAELDAFARTAAHDMKSPLQAIGGFSYLLRQRHAAALGADGQRMVAHIEQSTRHMATLVNDLLTLSRVSALTLHWADVDLAALGRELVADLRRQAPDRQVVFDAPAQLLLQCDGGLARSLLANLLGNAWKYTGRRPDAHIRLAAQHRGSVLEVCIEDNGVGFDAGTGDTLFKPFQRFHSDSEFTGTGIGLVTCQRIVHRHGGDIHIESTPGVGTVVRFTLQATSAVPDTQADTTSAAPGARDHRMPEAKPLPTAALVDMA